MSPSQGQVVVAYPAIRDNRVLFPCETLEAFRIGVVYNAPISEDARCLGCSAGRMCNLATIFGAVTCGPLCDCIHWKKKLRPRTYAQVHENRIESNYPATACCGACVCDNTNVIYFDKLSDSVVTAPWCTPYHCLCCIACCGGVTATAPMDCLNNCFCTCCRTFYPGLQDSDGFTAAIVAARAQFREGKRLGAGALGGPTSVRMD